MLFIECMIVKRTRRTVNFGGDSMLKVTYNLVNEDGEHHFITDIEPDKPYEVSNERVKIPVQVRVFSTRKGQPSYELAVDGGVTYGEEEF